MTAFLLVSILGCGLTSPADPVGDPADAAADPAGDDGAEGAEGEDAALTVEPALIRWNTETRTLGVQAQLAGPGVSTREEPVYVGVTVITTSGKVVDLLVHTLFPGALSEDLWFTVELSEDPEQVLIGAWSEKIEPCDVDRPGCKEFGFVLDGSLAAFPPGLYDEGMRQRMLPARFAIGMQGSAEPLVKAATAYAEVVGRGIDVGPVPEGASQEPGVWVARPDDLGFAHAVATSVGPALDYGVVEGLPMPMVVVLPASVAQ